MPNSTVPAADEGLPNSDLRSATQALGDALSDMEGDIITAHHLLDAAILLLEPCSSDPMLNYETDAIFTVVSAARNSVYSVEEKWKSANKLRRIDAEEA